MKGLRVQKSKTALVLWGWLRLAISVFIVLFDHHIQDEFGLQHLFSKWVVGCCPLWKWGCFLYVHVVGQPVDAGELILILTDQFLIRFPLFPNGSKYLCFHIFIIWYSLDWGIVIFVWGRGAWIWMAGLPWNFWHKLHLNIKTFL